MIRGFLVDKSDEHRMKRQTWAEGEMWSYALGWGEEVPVVTYRCRGCGYLESYAEQPAGLRAEGRVTFAMTKDLKEDRKPMQVSGTAVA